MLHPIPLFRPFGVVEPIQGAHQVTGDPADPLKADAFTNHDFFFIVLCGLHNRFLLQNG